MTCYTNLCAFPWNGNPMTKNAIREIIRSGLQPHLTTTCPLAFRMPICGDRRQRNAACQLVCLGWMTRDGRSPSKQFRHAPRHCCVKAVGTPSRNSSSSGWSAQLSIPSASSPSTVTRRHPMAPEIFAPRRISTWHRRLGVKKPKSRP